MVRWIVNDVPPTVFLLILVTCICAATLVSLTFVRRRFPSLADGEHNDVTNVGISVVGPVYGFFIGFIVAFLLSQLATEDEWARTEGTAAISMARELNVFNEADGRSTPEAEAALTRLYTAFADQHLEAGRLDEAAGQEDRDSRGERLL